MPQAGDHLGRFVVERELGQGGMGVVYLARDTLLNIKVAIKMLKPSLTKGDFFERFKREVLLARQVTHPGICRLFDIHAEQGQHFITMEYVQGKTLQALIQEKGILPLALVSQLIQSICNAVAAAHAQGIVHRDLKTSNIIVRDHGQIAILDFGLAKALNKTADSITQVGYHVGTYQYTAPEVLQGMPATARSDVYSLGIILYLCLTGRYPFAQENPIQQLNSQLAKTWIPPSNFNPVIQPGLEETIRKAMAPDPQERYPSVEALRDDVIKAIGEVSRPATEPTSSGPWNHDIEQSVAGVLTDPSYSEILKTHTRDTTMLFSDIVGITAYFDQHGDISGMKKIQRHNELLFPVVQRYQGHVVKTIGDAIMACFDSADQGLEAAIGMQQALEDFNQVQPDKDEQIFIRIGVHSGQSIFENQDVFGNTVNVAARICAQAGTGQILLSSFTRDMLDRMQEKTLYYDQVVLKGKRDAFNLYSVTWRQVEEFATEPAPQAPVDKVTEITPLHLFSSPSIKTKPTDLVFVSDTGETKTVEPIVSYKSRLRLWLVLSSLGILIVVLIIVFFGDGGESTRDKLAANADPNTKKPAIDKPVSGQPKDDKVLLVQPLVSTEVSVAPNNKPAVKEEPVPKATTRPIRQVEKPKQTMVAQFQQARSDLWDTMQKREILLYDDQRLEAEYRKVEELSKKGRYEAAMDAVERAQKLVNLIQVDESFVKQKLTRVNNFFDKLGKLEPSQKQQVFGLYEKVDASKKKGDFKLANRLLNQIVQLLSRK